MMGEERFKEALLETMDEELHLLGEKLDEEQAAPDWESFQGKMKPVLKKGDALCRKPGLCRKMESSDRQFRLLSGLASFVHRLSPHRFRIFYGLAAAAIVLVSGGYLLSQTDFPDGMLGKKMSGSPGFNGEAESSSENLEGEAAAGGQSPESEAASNGQSSEGEAESGSPDSDAAEGSASEMHGADSGITWSQTEEGSSGNTISFQLSNQSGEDISYSQITKIERLEDGKWILIYTVSQSNGSQTAYAQKDYPYNKGAAQNMTLGAGESRIETIVPEEYGFSLSEETYAYRFCRMIGGREVSLDIVK